MAKNSGARLSYELNQAQNKKFARDKGNEKILFPVSVWAIIVLTILKLTL